MKYLLFSILVLMGLIAQVPAADTTNPPAPYLTPEEELAKFVFQEPGYRLEPVVTDPIIKEPVLAVFDGNGRMYVAEMRSYMQDIDGNNELVPAGRVSLHWSSKGDGVFDKHTVFADHLVLPRMILPLDGGVLINETGSDNIWLYRDTKGDGVADQKQLFISGGLRGGNLEHQPSGLIWDLDNWLYMAVNNYRIRIKGTNLIGEMTAPNFGQWGLCQDDYGKPWFSNAGWESGPINFEIPIAYGPSPAINDIYGGDFIEVWPLITLGDYEGGPSRIRPDGTLNHFTGSCGQDIYRGDRLPPDLRGDLFLPEPVGRLIRRARIEVKEAFTRVYNRYNHSEFIRSTDPNFRPVNLMNAPDGTLYIVDMYRGIIQEGTWVRPGSFLRPVIQQNQVDQKIGRGRIWRLVYRDTIPGPQPRMLDETPAQLVPHLENPNGWWRDTAQKLLVLRGDQSVVPAVDELARSSTNRLGRIQALWTLEGLDALDPALLRQDLADPDPQIKIAAIRTSESLFKEGDSSFVPAISALANDPDPVVVLQVMLTASVLRWPGADSLIASIVATNSAFGIQKLGPQLFQASHGPVVPVFPPDFKAEDRLLLARGEQIYKQLCFTCHGLDGMGTPVQGATAPGTMAPSLAGSAKANGYRDGAINIVLKGLTGPQDGKTYPSQMVPMQGNDDIWVASVLSYIRNNFGNHSSIVTPADVARVRAAFKGRVDPWTPAELLATLPQPLTNRAQWKVNASQNPDSAHQAVDDNLKSAYQTLMSQAPGMWFQIDLPEETEIAGLELDAGSSNHDFPRGYTVELSLDGKDWGQPVATGHGTGALTEIIFPPARAKFIRINQTATSPGHLWTIQDLQVLKPSPPPPSPQSITAKKPANSLE